MGNFHNNYSNRLSQWFRFLVIILLIFGICLRFAYLEKRVYWIDEIATSFRVAGYTLSEVTQQVYNGQVQEPDDLLQYQTINPDKKLIDTLKSLAIEDAQHPPLYYIIARLWVQFVGYSPYLLRSLSVGISLLTFPLFYWLCIELFESSIFGYIALALTAVSFLHITYAREAREYSLWIVTILFSNAAFLRAIKFSDKLNFGIYTASIIMGLYTFPLTSIVLAGQGMYLAITEKFRLTKTFVYFLMSSLIAILSFLPWISIMLTNTTRISMTNTWMLGHHSIQDLIHIWLINLTDVFIGNPSKFSLFFVLILGYSLYFLFSQAPQRIWLFILMLMTANQFSFILSDLIFETSFSFYSRYLWPFLLSSQLVLTYMIGVFITPNKTQKNYLKILGVTILVITILAASIKSTLSLNKYKDDQIYLAAQLINQSKHPLIINFIQGDETILKKGIDITDIGDVFSLSYLLEDKVKLLLLKQVSIPKIANEFGDVYLLYISYKPENKSTAIPNLLRLTQKDYSIEPVVLKESEKTILWKIKPFKAKNA